MYRVVTKTMEIRDSQRRRCIHNGPWQPNEQWARNWASYLESTGLYDVVEVETNFQRSSSGNRYRE